MYMRVHAGTQLSVLIKRRLGVLGVGTGVQATSLSPQYLALTGMGRLLPCALFALVAAIAPCWQAAGAWYDAGLGGMLAHLLQLHRTAPWQRGAAATAAASTASASATP
jgi:hypothetical protein